MNWATDQIIDTLLKWLAEAIVGGLDDLWGLLSRSVFVSPNVTELPQVQAFTSTSLGIVNTAYVLAILWMAILVMGRDSIQSRYGPGELIPRLVIGLIAANMSTPLCSTLIELANALTTALTSQDITKPGSVDQLHLLLTSTLGDQMNDGGASILLLIIAIVIAVLVATLIVQYIVRLGVLIIAVGIAPIALALHGTPQTEAAAKLWWRTIFGALGTVVLQAVSLHTGLSIFLDPNANLLPMGEEAKQRAIMNLLVVLCLLLGVTKIPSLVRRYVTRTPPSQLGTIMRVVLIQQITSVLRRGMSSGKRLRPTAATDVATARGGWPVGKPGATTYPRKTGGTPAVPGRPTPPAPRPASNPAALPPPRGAAPGVVGVAFPSGRPVKPYTAEELRRGVDAYTKTVKKPNPGKGRTI